jgi:hypothetical protein
MLERRAIEIVEAWNQFAASTIIDVGASCERLANRLDHLVSVPIVPALSEPWAGACRGAPQRRSEINVTPPASFPPRCAGTSANVVMRWRSFSVTAD